LTITEVLELHGAVHKDGDNDCSEREAAKSEGREGEEKAPMEVYEG
jgi:hypothetical protein